jgi:hypothetical protein
LSCFVVFASFFPVVVACELTPFCEAGSSSSFCRPDSRDHVIHDQGGKQETRNVAHSFDFFFPFLSEPRRPFLCFFISFCLFVAVV